MNVVGKTDVGLVREINEDYFSVTDCAGGKLCVLCDGMGGHNAGEVASKIAAETISGYLVENLAQNMSDDDIATHFDNAIKKANDEVLKVADLNPQNEGMGTTVVIALFVDNVLFLSHVGDSRCYLIREGVLIGLTKDHSLMQQMLDNGEISEDSIENFPFKNVITRCIGTSEGVSGDFAIFETETDDIILMCSDGLTNYCSSEDIVYAVIGDSFEESADRLVEKAKDGGGGDNITVVLIQN
ncbi:MAG TPA: Stp1/IreP family PP2C-type Ser/Thr phosphatase [Clostridiales bacterium]|jgi:protein phosphatase|nr:Stp1/IreP family PP2C-type Ser/Thr phosphatase [Clostridiales bacterium]